ncbi:MAG: N-6 DNA methylase, partial [gamma proteobacterium symbiont of Lucinoma myriamae]|nr:N-6 DNA methylase [gamma proteobacterium symbiont of Lucinoma myriamae]
MTNLKKYKNFIKVLGFSPKENTSGIFFKKYTDSYAIELDFDNKLINYGAKIKSDSKTTQNFSQAENWVVLECVDRILEKGYKPQNIILEKTWKSGHGTSGRLDICITRDDGTEFLLIECKTWGKEFEKELAQINKTGGQLFTYFKFSNKADVIMLYTSNFDDGSISYRNELIKIEDDYRTGDVKDFYDKWNKLTNDNGIFDTWVNPYKFISKALTPKLLESIKQEDSGFIFNRFLEILRHNVVSDKPNAFNKIFTLFLCKIYDEKTTPENEELKFQWLEGKDDNISFQMRLADLYKNGMYEFLDKRVTDFSTSDFENKYKGLSDKVKDDLLKDIIKLRLEKNNEFAIKEVFDTKSFEENAKVVKQVVGLLQKFKLRYTKKQQYLSDFFELLLTTGLKQESGQFFTPVPIAQFIIKSIPLDQLMDNKLSKGEKNNLLPYVMDYAAGSGHFLTEMMHETQRLIDKKDPSSYISDTAKKIKNWQEDHFDWALQYVYGIEKDYRLVKVGKVGCYLHGDGLANVIHSDGLGNFKKTDEYKDQLAKIDSNFPKENKQFDLVVSNPPYSVSAFKQNARSYYTEDDFELYEKLTDNSSEIECLFVERTKQLLKDGGMAGIILPSSILSNTGIYTKTREIILQHFDIVAIAELGSNTFMATGTNTVILFLRRKNNYDSINLKSSVNKFFTNLQDVTLNGIEKPAAKYVAHTWEGILFEDYLTLLQKQPNEAIQQYEIYQEYQKKIKAKNRESKWNEILDLEQEKI